MKFRRPQRQNQETDIDLTSLIDVIFILLIFFLVTATFSQSQDTSMSVDLPEGSSGGAIDIDEELTIYIENDGRVSLRIEAQSYREGIAPEALQQELQQLYASRGPQSVFLRGDENVRYGEVVRVLDACRDAGYKKVFNVVRGKNP